MQQIVFRDGQNSTLYVADLYTGLQQIGTGTVHCAVTSPPYFQLRAYAPHLVKIDPVLHESVSTGVLTYLTDAGIGPVSPGVYDLRTIPADWRTAFVQAEIGRENDPDAYVAEMVKAFGEVWRVLRDDGSFWLNIGDSYVPSAGKLYPQQGSVKGQKSETVNFGQRTAFGLPKKNLVGIPWRLASALQDAGWYLRADIIWAKSVSFSESYIGTCMPEAVRDRPTRSHEYLFLLTKQPSYYYDIDAVREQYVSEYYELDETSASLFDDEDDDSDTYDAIGRNLRSVWCIPVEHTRHKHTAPFPRALVRPCIKLGTSEHGVCAACGAPWKRIVVKGDVLTAEEYSGQAIKDYEAQQAQNPSDIKRRALKSMVQRSTAGWKPTCACGTTEVVPATVLDPFFGSGTVGIVAAELGRRFLGCELNPEFAQLAAKRIEDELSERPTSLFE